MSDDTDAPDQTLRFLGRRRGEAFRTSVTDAGSSAASRSEGADVHAMTDQGQVRKNNEDQFLIADIERSMCVHSSSVGGQKAGQRITGSPQGRLLMVADGMGGHDGGEVASAVVVDAMAYNAFTILPWLMADRDANDERFVAGVRDALKAAQERLRRVAQRKGLDASLGTTLTAAYVTWPLMHILHAGDSRCYMLRRGQLTRITRDHTVAQRLLDSHAITEEQAKNSIFSHVLVNVIGGGTDDLDVDLHLVELKTDDIVLLCTDGLTSHLNDDEIRDLLATAESCKAACERLVNLANQRGGSDNVTVIVTRF